MRTSRLSWAAAVVLGLGVGGTLLLNGSTPDEASPQSDSEPHTVPVMVDYLGDTPVGPRLFQELHTVEAEAETNVAAVLAAANEVVAGAPADPDYRNPWPTGVVVEDVSSTGVGSRSVTRIDLAGTEVAERPVGMTTTEARATLTALVGTVREFLGVRGEVIFYRDGTLQETVLGLDTRSARKRFDHEELRAPVQIAGPTEGDVITTDDIAVIGTAVTRDGVLSWQLLAGNRVVDAGIAATARGCCVRTAYTFRITDVPSGSYLLVVRATDPELVEHQDTKAVVVDRADDPTV